MQRARVNCLMVQPGYLVDVGHLVLVLMNVWDLSRPGYRRVMWLSPRLGCVERVVHPHELFGWMVV